MGQRLTAELQGWLAGSGTSGSSRFDGDDLRWPRRGTGQRLTASPMNAKVRPGTLCGRRIEQRRPSVQRMKMASRTALQGFRKGVGRWGGRGGRGGASGPVREARGRRWLQLRRTASAAALCFGRGGEGGEAGREGRGARESEGGQGDRDGLWKSSTRPGARRQAGGGRAAVRVRARSSFGARGGRRRRAAVVGWAGCWLGRPAGWAAQWRSPGKLLLLYIFLFSNF